MLKEMGGKRCVEEVGKKTYFKECLMIKIEEKQIRSKTVRRKLVRARCVSNVDWDSNSRIRMQFQ